MYVKASEPTTPNNTTPATSSGRPSPGLRAKVDLKDGEQEEFLFDVFKHMNLSYQERKNLNNIEAYGE